MNESFFDKAFELVNIFDKEHMALDALNNSEVPVGCVFVKDNKIIGTGRNRTNELKNATKHAEIVAIEEILKSHKKEVLKDSVLYVTVEPCIMCASALRILGIKKVYFGCGNDKFGGCGSVLDCHENLFPENYSPYIIESGYKKHEAIMLLRQFYLKTNDSAPKPKKKCNRVLKLVDQ